MKHRLLQAAIVVLALRLLWMYLIPAWSGITTDFQNYYVAARTLRHHDSTVDLYDMAWFQHESERAGITEQTALFNYYTPISALVMWPVANLPPLDAQRVWTFVNLVALLLTVLLTARSLQSSPTLILLIALLGGDALGNNFTFGQFYIVLTLLLVLAILALEKRPLFAGASLSCAAAIKLFPAVFILQFASLRKWRAIVLTVVGVVLITLGAIAVVGWVPHRVFMEEVLPRIVRGEIQDPYNVRWNTLQALLRRAFVAEPGLNPQPVADLPFAFFLLRPLTALSIVVLTVWKLQGRKFGFVEYGAVIAAVSLITPSQASYHQILFFPAVAGLVCRARNREIQMAVSLLFALLCSNYMGATARWDSGLVMLLAFPRVYLVLLLWIIFMAGEERGYETRDYIPSRTFMYVVAGFIPAFALASAGLEWQRWKADDADHAVMARPEEHGLLEAQPSAGAMGLVFSALRPEGYTLHHPAAFGSGLVYEWHGGVAGHLPNGTEIHWPGALEPALSGASVVAVAEDGRRILERSPADADWRELFRRETILHDPAISPDGTSIAFSEWAHQRYRISEWNRTTGTIRVLLEGRGDFRYPSYAPGGGKLAFASNEPGNWDVAEYSLETGRYSWITRSAANDYMPVYAPDGSRLYFASDRRRGYRFTAIFSISLKP